MRSAIVSLLAKFRTLKPVRRGLFVVLALVVGLLVFARMTPTPVTKHIQPTPATESAASGSSELQMEAGRAKEESKEYAKVPRAPLPLDSRDFPASRVTGIMLPGDPLIAHTAELAVATKEFAKSRSALDEILDRHRG